MCTASPTTLSSSVFVFTMYCGSSLQRLCRAGRPPMQNMQVSRRALPCGVMFRYMACSSAIQSEHARLVIL